MVLLFVLLACVALYGVKVSSHHEDYISKPVTDSIKGIFAIIIIYSHGRGYLPSLESLTSPFDIMFYKAIQAIGQLMVVMFLFYSGYGIMESYRKKPGYLRGFAKHRILKTLVIFDVAVILYIALGLLLGKTFSIPEYILSFVGWESIDNSNWFGFDIIALYLLVYLALAARSRWNLSPWVFYIVVFMMCGAFIVFVAATKKESYWYDTVLAFPAGLVYSEFKEKIERAFRNYYWPSLGALIVAFSLMYGSRGYLTMILTCVVFALILVLVTMKVKLNNRALRWLGINCFGIYILQRIPMALFSELGLTAHWAVFYVAVVAATLVLAAGFTKATGVVCKKLGL